MILHDGHGLQTVLVQWVQSLPQHYMIHLPERIYLRVENHLQIEAEFQSYQQCYAHWFEFGHLWVLVHRCRELHAVKVSSSTLDKTIDGIKFITHAYI